MRLPANRTWKTHTLLVTVALLLPGCGQDPRQEQVQALRRDAASAQAQPASHAEAARTAADPTHKALLRAFDKLRTAYPYRLTDKSTVTTNIGLTIQPMVRISEHAAPDRARVKWRRGGLSGEIVAIEGKTYLHANGTWQAADRASAAKPSADLTQMLASGITDVQLVGTDSASGVTSSAYTFRFQWKALGMIFDGTGKAWVRTDDGLPARTEMETRTGLFDMKSQVAYEYNVPIDIEQPAL
ncbi:MAG: hypothetical protein GEU99_03010 [Luteitalea sp.]|nr:hypothetical protein [Luteitalea sp.]